MNNNIFEEMKTMLSSNDNYVLTNFDDLLQVPLTMFEYDNIPDELTEYFELFELWLSTNKCVAVGKHNGRLIFARGGLGGGHINEYGFMTHFIGTTANGESIDWEIGKDCAVIWNNLTKSPDLDLIKTAEHLTEIDISIDDNILYSRFYPVPMVEDETQKKQIESIFDMLKKGMKKMSIVNRRANIADVMNGTPDNVPMLNLTDVSLSDKIQYLAHHRDDVKRWFYTKYGHCVQSTGKMAQQTEKEIDGNTSVSFIYPLSKLRAREKGLKEINKLFSTNITIKFSEPWAVEYAKFIQSAEPETGTQGDEPETVTQGDELEAGKGGDVNVE